MNSPIKHTATYKNQERTLSLSGWARVTGKSRTFLNSMLNEASLKGVSDENAMGYAIKQVPGERLYRDANQHRWGCHSGDEAARKRNEERLHKTKTFLLAALARTYKVSAEKESPHTEYQVIHRRRNCYLV